MSKQPGPSLIQVPHLFSVVEAGVYRCASPKAAQVPFLATLGLKTIISLTPEHPIKPLLDFTRSTGVDFIHLGLNLWRPPGIDWKPIRDEIVKCVLEEYILDTRAHPILLIDPIGVHHTGCVVGALRVMQGWNFASILVEYRAHAGSKHRYADEQYIELFDPDLVNLPPAKYRPEWWTSCIDNADSEYDDDNINDIGGGEGDTGNGGTTSREVNGSVPGQEGAKEGVLFGHEQDVGRTGAGQGEGIGFG